MTSQKKHIIIGKGHHACIVRESLPCDPDRTIREFSQKMTTRHGNVSKIFKNVATWRDEINEVAKISKIESANEYFVVPVAACSVLESLKANIVEGCDIIEKVPDELPQLIMPYGGVSLNEYIYLKSTKISFAKWCNILLKILNCINILSLNKLVHMDLKKDNIVYDERKDMTRLIDFGLTESFEVLYSYEKALYRYYPLEFIIASKDKTDDIHNKFSSQFTDQFSQHIKRFIYPSDVTFFKYDNELINTSVETLKQDENLSKIDIYALGITCIELSEKINMDAVPVKDKYKSLVKKMAAVDFRKRISIKDAIGELTEIIHQLKKRPLTSKECGKKHI
jgi:serine/threonine protein kinase